MESDPRFNCKEVLEILAENYPFVETEKRVIVLKWLCDFFLETQTFKSLISAEGHIDVSFEKYPQNYGFSRVKFAVIVESRVKLYFAMAVKLVTMLNVLICKLFQTVNDFARCVKRTLLAIQLI